MAKLKAPLLSLGAAGALGKTIVYFPWKGINSAREYVVPSNPQTAPQVTQRGYVTDAVEAIHTAQGEATHPLDEADQTALSALASVGSKIMTWFNQMVKLWLDVKVLGNVPVIYRDGTVSDTTVGSVNLRLYITEETPATMANGTFYCGLSKTNLVHAITGTVNAGANVELVAEDMSGFAAAGDKIYFQFRPDVADGCEGANSGIYHFTAT